MPDSRSYNDDDVQAIIQRALKEQSTVKGDLTHADLLSIGEQVGLSAEAIERAAQDVLEARRATEATAAHTAFTFGTGVSAKRQQRERARIDAEASAQPRPQLRVADAKRATDAIDEAPTDAVESKRNASS